MEKINRKGFLKFIFKVSVSALALYVVFRKIDLAETKDIIIHAIPGWLILALLAFNLSKVISAFRLNLFFRSIGVRLTESFNLRLYYVGMFYNLFLPGGIGGDGYKVYLLNRTHRGKLKQLISATLLDRISGLIALVMLALVLTVFIDLTFAGTWVKWVAAGIILLIYPVFFLVFKMLFIRFIGVFYVTSVYSIGVQLSQLLSAFFILKALAVPDQYVEYMTLFLFSSIVAVIPFTIGGVGARELVFILGANNLMIDKNTAVAFSLLFFLITALSSFAGILFETRIKAPAPEEEVNTSG